MTITELLEDLLTEFDEFDMQPMLPMPGDPIEKAKEWKHELEYALNHLKAEVAREIFAELYKSVASKTTMQIRPIFKDDLNFEDGFRNGKNDAFLEVLLLIAELKKKYIGEQK